MAKSPIRTKPAVKSAPTESAQVRQPHRGLTRMKRMTSIRSSHFDDQFAFRAGKTYFEAASPSKRLEYAPDYGPNAANGEIETVRRRSRWTYANDAFYRQSCRQIANNVVHYGIKPSNVLDPVLLDLWKRWMKEADARGRLDFHGIQWLTALVVARDGEGFIRFRSRKPGDMKSGINFQLQCLEADYVPLDKTEMAANGNLIVSGVERDLIERVQAYHMYDYHPKDVWLAQGNSVLPRRVPASEVLHVYMPDRFSDTRGYPHGAAALNTSESRKTFDDAHLETKKGHAMHGGFIRKPLGEDGAVIHVEGVEEDGIEFAGMEPNTWHVLPDGYDVTFAQPPSTDPNYGVYRRETLSEIAISFGLAVEHITLNFEKLGDRQYRAVMLECTRYFESLQYHMIVRQLSQPVWERFVDEAYLNDLWKPAEGRTVDSYKQIDWMNPARGHIHPVQEIAAFSQAIRDGITSRKRVAASHGEDIEDIDRENAEDQARSKRLGLMYPVYPGLEHDALLQQSLLDDAAENGTEQPDGDTPPGNGAIDPNDYGVAVRAGLVTPQVEDEAAIRRQLKLPEMSASVQGLWDTQSGYRQPITLAGSAPTNPFGGGAPADPEGFE